MGKEKKSNKTSPSNVQNKVNAKAKRKERRKKVIVIILGLLLIITFLLSQVFAIIGTSSF